MNIGLNSLSKLVRSVTRPALTRSAIAAGLVMLSLTVFACEAGKSQPGSGGTPITVPDEISRLPSDEVERRLGGLVGSKPSEGPSHGAPGTEPTPIDSIDEILNALASRSLSEVLITVSPSLLEDISDPRLVIKSQPSKGTAVALSDSEILFIPDGGATGSDSFEYELLDGETPVFSSVVELRPASAATSEAGGVP